MADGAPAIEQLEKQYGTKWASYKGGRAKFEWHNVIYQEINRLISIGKSSMKQ